MGKTDSTNSEQLDFNRLGEAYFDCASVAAERGYFQFAVRGQGKPYKTIIVETAADRNGNLQGYVDVYLGSAVNGSPWRTIPMGGGRSGPCPAVDFFTFVPRVVGGAPTLGTVSITVSTEIWGSYFRKPATATYFPLEDLTDAAISSPVAGQVLTWNGTEWVNATPASAPATPEAVYGNGFASNSPTQIGNGGVVAGNLLVCSVCKGQTNAAPTGWTLVFTYGNLQIYSRIATATSADIFNASGFGSCAGWYEEFANATSVYAAAGYTTTGYGGGSTLAAVNVTGPSEVRVLTDGQSGVVYDGAGWTTYNANSVGGRQSVMGARYVRNPVNGFYCATSLNGGGTYPQVIYAVK